ncbi:MAG: hypothetical protein ACI4KR_09260 [Ruminiclostridium sp.]
MGQRLNIEIRHGGKCIANAYYHWSAYTLSAAELTSEIINFLDSERYDSDICSDIDNIRWAIRALESTGAGLTGAEKNYITDELPGLDASSFADAADRNRGLIAVSEEGMAETERWMEEGVTIYLDERLIDFGVVFGYGSIAEATAWWDENAVQELRRDVNLLPRINCDFENIPFEDFDDVAEQLSETSSSTYGIAYNPSSERFVDIIR